DGTRSDDDLPEWVRAVPVARVDADGVEQLCPGVWDLETTTPSQALDLALWPSVTAVVHIPRSVWLGEHGPVHVDGHGPITAEQCFDRLRHSHVVVKPVVDLDDQPVSASDEFTGRLREAVLMANTFNPFPYADTRSRADDDIDHTIPRNRGGPTSIDNGGPLRRRQHRFKTHAEGWEVKQPFTGLFVWRTPTGRVYVVDRRGDTHDLGLAG
ncbi:MAG: HNH endonuclease signature motif containing protein, partial [Nocardioidaceae bacterium]